MRVSDAIELLRLLVHLLEADLLYDDDTSSGCVFWEVWCMARNDDRYRSAARPSRCFGSKSPLAEGRLESWRSNIA